MVVLAIQATDVVTVELATEMTTGLGLGHGKPGQRTGCDHMGSSSIEETPVGGKGFGDDFLHSLVAGLGIEEVEGPAG